MKCNANLRPNYFPMMVSVLAVKKQTISGKIEKDKKVDLLLCCFTILVNYVNWKSSHENTRKRAGKFVVKGGRWYNIMDHMDKIF